MNDESYLILHNCMYQIFDYLHSLEECKLYNEGGEEITNRRGFSCIVPGGEFFPENRANAKSLRQAYRNSDSYSVEFAFWPRGSSHIIIIMQGKLEDILKNGEFDLELIKRNPNTRKVEASLTYRPQSLQDMKKTIDTIEMFLNKEVRKKLLI